MSNDKMRQEFETWYLSEYFEGDKECGLEWLSTEPCGDYRYDKPQSQWKVWKASRAAVEVSLSSLQAYAWHVENGIGTGLVRYDDACAAVEAAGIKVAE